MDTGDRVLANQSVQVQDDLRQKTAAYLLDHLDQFADDALAIFPFGGSEGLDVDATARVARALVHMIARAVRDGSVDPRGECVDDLHRIMSGRTLSVELLFTFAYLTERTVLDELAIDQSIGATSESWPLVVQLVRRASFDLLGAVAERARLEPSGVTLVDRLTTLYTRPLFDAVLTKELVRASRSGDVVSLLLFDVDRLSEINNEHGYGVGDKILERIGILIRKYFRQHDWVARYAEDSIAVLLSRTDARDASALAERVRQTVETRLRFVDHRNDIPVPVTLSAAVISLRVEVGDIIDPERLMANAEAAVGRAKQQGGNRVARVDAPRSTPHARG